MLHTRQPRTLQRFVALALALLFVVQSAATAASGCWSAALGVGCCCVRADAEPGTSSDPVSASEVPARAHSCCARPEVEPATGEQATPTTPAPGPRTAPRNTCGCKLAPLPSAPANTPTTSDELDRAGVRGGFADWIAAAAPRSADGESFRTQSVAAPPTGPPDGPTRVTPTSLSSRRLASRGVIGLLSGLCTLRT